MNDKEARMCVLAETADRRILDYRPQGRLDVTARSFIELLARKSACELGHAVHVALMAEAAAYACGIHPQAGFFAGLLHDYGKRNMPAQWTGGENIADEDVLLALFWHTLLGYEELKNDHLICAFVAGMHHERRCMRRYGVVFSHFASLPRITDRHLIAKLSFIVGVCDSLEASLNRTSVVLGLSGSGVSAVLAEYAHEASFAKLIIQISEQVIQRNRELFVPIE